MGVHVEYLYPRHTSMMAWMGKERGIRAYKSGEISLLGRWAQTEHEVGQLVWFVNTYRPRVEVPTTPMGHDLDRIMRNHVYVADGSQHGDVLAGLWKVGVKNLSPLSCFSEEPVRSAGYIL